MRENIIKTKSFAFAVSIVKLYQYLCNNKKEFVLSKQLLRSGTSVGAMVREAEHKSNRIFNNAVNAHAIEIIKIITTIIKTTKSNINN